MKVLPNGAQLNPCDGEKKSVNSELWQACAGPLVSLPPVGSYVVYFPQGHSEQVAASMQKDADAHIPNYSNLPPKLICLLHNVTLHADAETDEVYAQMTLQPVKTYDKEALLASDLALKPNGSQTEFFCKTLTASDTSTHGGFSVPRRAAERIFPPLDFSMQPPAQELVAKDLHDNAWTFRHIYRGKPKRHLLTTGWSLFVSGKRLVAGDSVLFIRDQKQQLLLGIRRANRQTANISSSVLSSDSMHIGILAAAAHAAANHSPFTVFYNPRASPSEFVLPVAKYNKAIYSHQISQGMRFRMMFETEESGTRRYMGTITGMSDLDPIRWKNSPWRNLQVGWDESTAGERRNRVSIWEIEPVQTPFFICPPPIFGSKRPRLPGMPDDDSIEVEDLFKRTMPWMGEDLQSLNSGWSLVQWMNKQQTPLVNSTMHPDYLGSLMGPALQKFATTDISRQLDLQAQMLQQNNLSFSASRPSQLAQQLDHLQNLPLNQIGSLQGTQQQQTDSNLHQRQSLVNQTLPSRHSQMQLMQPQISVQNASVERSPHIQNHPQQSNLNHAQQLQQFQQQERTVGLNQQVNLMLVELANQANQLKSLPENQIQLQLLQKLKLQQQQALISQQLLHAPQPTQLQEQQRQLLEVSQELHNASTLSQQQLVGQQMATNSQAAVRYSQPMKQPQLQPQPQLKLQQQGSGLTKLPGLAIPPHPSATLLSASPNGLIRTGGCQSGVTDDYPTCSTSSLTNCSILPRPVLNKGNPSALVAEEMAQSTSTVLSSGTLEAVATARTACHIKPSSKTQSQCTFVDSSPQMDYFDSSSSGTSVCLSQTDVSLQQNFPLSCVNSLAVLFRETTQDEEVNTDPRNNAFFGVNNDGRLGMPPLTPDPLLDKGIGSGKDFHNQLPQEDLLANYVTSKEVQRELSSSVVSQSFGVADMSFNLQGVSMDSTINDGSFLNGSSWAPPPPQPQRMRTFTKVYKRGAVGRSVDITSYSGYDELKQDLARRFGIEGQLEDRHRVGWKLVYVDHENDVLLLGDDPWEEFVNCVRCIKIFSPQEVQQMSLDGDLGNGLLPNQACGSSGNPSAGSYDR